MKQNSSPMMGPATKATADRLAAAIREVATEQRHYRLAERAAGGEFADYGEAHVCPITECHRLCRQYGLHSIADRLADGEFDASKEESDEWARSASGQEIAQQLSPDMRKLLGLDPAN
jgi:hypothetical protein